MFTLPGLRSTQNTALQPAGTTGAAGSRLRWRGAHPAVTQSNGEPQAPPTVTPPAPPSVPRGEHDAPCRPNVGSTKSAKALREELTSLEAEDQQQSLTEGQGRLSKLETTGRSILLREEARAFHEYISHRSVWYNAFVLEVVPAVRRRLVVEEEDGRRVILTEELSCKKDLYEQQRALLGLQRQFVVRSKTAANETALAVELHILSQRAKLSTAVEFIQLVGRRYLRQWHTALHEVFIPQDAKRREMRTAEDILFGSDILWPSAFALLAMSEEANSSAGLRAQIDLTLVPREHRLRVVLSDFEEQTRLSLQAAENVSRVVLIPERLYFHHTILGLAKWTDELRLNKVLTIQQSYRQIFSSPPSLGRTATNAFLRQWVSEHRQETREHPTLSLEGLERQLDFIEDLMAQDHGDEAHPEEKRTGVSGIVARHLGCYELAEERGRGCIEAREQDYRTLFSEQLGWEIYWQLTKKAKELCSEDEPNQRRGLEDEALLWFPVYRHQLVEGRVRWQFELAEGLNRRNLKALSTGRPVLVKITMWIQRKWRYMLAQRRADEQRIEEMRAKLKSQSQLLSSSGYGSSSPLSATLVEPTDGSKMLSSTLAGTVVRRNITLSPYCTALGLQIKSPLAVPLHRNHGTGPLSPQVADFSLEQQDGTTKPAGTPPAASPTEEAPADDVCGDENETLTISVVVTGPVANEPSGPPGSMITPTTDERDEEGAQELLCDEEGRVIVTESNKEAFLRLYGSVYFDQLFSETQTAEERERTGLVHSLDSFFYYRAIEQELLFPSAPTTADIVPPLEEPGEGEFTKKEDDTPPSVLAPAPPPAETGTATRGTANARRTSRRNTLAANYTRQLTRRRRYTALVVVLEEEETIARRDIAFDQQVAWRMYYRAEVMMQQSVEYNKLNDRFVFSGKESAERQDIEEGWQTGFDDHIFRADIEAELFLRLENELQTKCIQRAQRLMTVDDEMICGEKDVDMAAVLNRHFRTLTTLATYLQRWLTVHKREIDVRRRQRQKLRAEQDESQYKPSTQLVYHPWMFFAQQVNAGVADLVLNARDEEAGRAEDHQSEFDAGMPRFCEEYAELIEGAKAPEVIEYYVTHLLEKVEDDEEDTRNIYERVAFDRSWELYRLYLGEAVMVPLYNEKINHLVSSEEPTARKQLDAVERGAWITLLRECLFQLQAAVGIDDQPQGSDNRERGSNATDQDESSNKTNGDDDEASILSRQLWSLQLYWRFNAQIRVALLAEEEQASQALASWRVAAGEALDGALQWTTRWDQSVSRHVKENEGSCWKTFDRASLEQQEAVRTVSHDDRPQSSASSVDAVGEEDEKQTAVRVIQGAARRWQAKTLVAAKRREKQMRRWRAQIEMQESCGRMHIANGRRDQFIVLLQHHEQRYRALLMQQTMHQTAAGLFLLQLADHKGCLDQQEEPSAAVPVPVVPEPVQQETATLSAEQQRAVVETQEDVSRWRICNVEHANSLAEEFFAFHDTLGNARATEYGQELRQSMSRRSVHNLVRAMTTDVVHMLTNVDGRMVWLQEQEGGSRRWIEWEWERNYPIQ